MSLRAAQLQHRAELERARAEGTGVPYYARPAEVVERGMEGRVGARFSVLETDCHAKTRAVDGKCHNCGRDYSDPAFAFCPWCGQRKACTKCGGRGGVRRMVVVAKHDDGHTEEREENAECDRCQGTGRDPLR